MAGVPRAFSTPSRETTMRTRVGLHGDIHCQADGLEKPMQILKAHGVSTLGILGDYGYGWPSYIDGDGNCGVTAEIDLMAEEFGLDVWFIDGNHENFDQLRAVGAYGSEVPVKVAERVTYIPRGTLQEIGESQVLFIGGAYSVDKRGRSPHISWWQEEEITVGEAYRALSHETANVVLSHDVCDTGFRAALSLALYPGETNRHPAALNHLIYKNDQAFPQARHNRHTLEAVWEKYHPERWIHGHYHASYETREYGTVFHGLANNQHPGAFEIVEF